MWLLVLLCGLLLSSLLAELTQALANKKEYDGQHLNRIAALAADFASAEVADEEKQGQLRTTGLRIFVLIRLGTSDSAQISRMRGSSINTICNVQDPGKEPVGGAERGT